MSEVNVPESKVEVFLLPLRKAVVEYIPNFLTQGEAEKLFKFCLEHLPFENHQVRIYGKYLDQPRKTCMVGKKYTYSGLSLDQPTPMPPQFEEVIDRLVLFLPKGHPRPNAVLCNLYENGERYISQHSDNEKDLLPGSTICGLSLGATRHFDLIAKDKSEPRFRQDLVSGSMIIMGDGTQKHYTHGVPVEKKVRNPRINLTFRVIRE